MKWLPFIFIALIVLALKYAELLLKRLPKNNDKRTDYSHSYQSKYLLTKNEWSEYKKLQKHAAEKRLIICPKVRLLDIIEPRKGEQEYKSLLNKVQSKHVDFLICDQDLHIKAVLELDDNSHDRKDRKERDAFVDQILTSVGYTVIHTRAITETTLDVLNKPEKEATEQT